MTMTGSRTQRQLAAITSLAVLVALAGGCHNGSDGSNDVTTSDSTHFTGVGTSTTDGANGSLQVNVYNSLLPAAGGAAGASMLQSTAATVTVQGTFFPKAGGQVAMNAGQLDTGTGQFTLSGGGYTFNGARQGDVLTGTFTGGAGSGSFVAAKDDAATAIAFCGGWNETTGDSGPWNFVTTAQALRGDVYITGAQYGISGSRNGNDVSVWQTDDPQHTVIATGSITGNAAAGTFNTGTSQGTWNGARCP